MKVLLKALLFSALTLIAHTSYAANCQSNRSGNWSASNTWTSCGGTAPKSGDNVTIRNGHQVTLDVNTGGFNSLTINANSSLLKDWGSDVYTVTVGDLTNNGTITFRNTSNITVSNILVNYGQITFVSHTGSLIATGPNINYNSIVADSGSATIFRFLNSLTNSGTLQLGQSAAINSFYVGGTLTNSGLIGASFSSDSTSLNSTGLSSNSGDLLIQNFVNTTTGLVNIGFGNPNLRVYGNFVNNNPNLNLENAFFSLIGNSYQSVTGLKKVFSFTLNNPAGAILNSNLQLGIGTNQNGGLVLRSGKLDTADSSYITYNQVCTQGNNYFHRNVGSWVTGKFLQKFAINQSGSCTFPVGTTFNYSPITLTSNSWPAPQTGSVIIQAFHGDHPDTVANISGINPSLSLNKYWNISSPDNSNLFQNSLFSLNASVCSNISGSDCTINDFDNGVSTNSLIARFNDTNSWSNVNILSQTSSNITINNLSDMGTITFGEYKAPTTVGGQTSASNFAILDPTILSTWDSSARKPLFTKLSGTPFSLDIAALNSDGTVESNLVNASNPTKTITLELFNYNSTTACSAYTSPISSQSVTFNTTNSHFYQGRVTSGLFTINSAHKEVVARVTDNSNTQTIQSCSTDTFTIRPTQLNLFSTSANSDPLGISNSSASTIPTGNPFTMTVGSNTVGYNGIPTIDATKINWNNLPLNGQIGIIGGSFSAANPTSGNNSTSNTFTYSEVGYFNFLAQGIHDSTFISSNDLTNGDCTTNFSNSLTSNKYGCYFGNTSSTSYVGRFIPAKFNFINSTINNRVDSSCSPTSSFTYLNEPLSLNTTIQALNHNNQIVKNYSGNFNRFDSLSFNLRANTSLINLTPKINLISQSGNFVNGVNNYSTKFSINRDSTPTNPYLNAFISSAFNDLDNVKSSPINTDSNLDTINDSTLLGNTNFYFGRLHLMNNKGSDLLPLKIDLFTEYFDNNSFKTMSLDSCTTLSSSNFTTSNFLGDLAANETSFTYPNPLRFSNGSLTLLVNKPSGGDGKYSGTFEFNYNLLSDNKAYLQSQWTGNTSYNQNPKSQVTIAKKTSNSKFLFIKELY